MNAEAKSMDDLLNPHDVAAILSVKTGTLNLWRSRKRGPAYLKIEGEAGNAKCIRYRRADVVAWIEKQTRIDPGAKE